ncbi:MAG: pilus assembly PilX N-terminal domain-containing protein [Gammaproteobacteria bacterium]|nr:pilus assembly PilX N-terminal domain-containing protein [Gammaproteobacteria bacterium]
MSRQQSGAALIVSLILLMVLTVLAISTMRTASLGLLMAGNAQVRQNAFQLAQAGIDDVIRDDEPVGVGDCTAPVEDPAVAVPELRGSYVTSVCYRGESISPGSSFPRITTYNYEVTSAGATDERDARARLVQGYALTGASGR